MPQADYVLTVPLETKPTGFLADLSPVRGTIVENVQIRLAQLSSVLFLLKNSEFVDREAANAIGAIETSLNDCLDLLSVCAPVVPGHP